MIMMVILNISIIKIWFLVMEEDTIPPTITGCPGTLTFPTDAGSNTAVATWTEPTATDNSGISPTRLQTHRSGESFSVGQTEVTYIFTDQAGNAATCSFTVTGNDVI